MKTGTVYCRGVKAGDYILTPAYDLLNTSVHFPNEPSATGEAKTRYVAKFRDRLRAIAQ